MREAMIPKKGTRAKTYSELTPEEKKHADEYWRVNTSKKTEADKMIQMGAETKLVQHYSLETAIAQFIPPEAMAAPDEWTVGAEASGADREYTVSEYIEEIRKHQPCWGVCKKSVNEIHFWIGAKATLSDIMALFAHEFGHLEPWLVESPESEELRSEAFGRVAVRALCAIRETFGDSWAELEK